MGFMTVSLFYWEKLYEKFYLCNYCLEVLLKKGVFIIFKSNRITRVALLTMGMKRVEEGIILSVKMEGSKDGR